MLQRIRKSRDPYWDDGVAARERDRRASIEGMIAFALALTACVLTAAVWLQPLVPFVASFGPH